MRKKKPMVTCIRDGTDIGSSAPNPVSSLRNFTQILRREVMYSVAGKTYKKKSLKVRKNNYETFRKKNINISFSQIQKFLYSESFFILEKLLNTQLYKINPVFKIIKFPKAITKIFSHNYKLLFP